MKLKTANDIYYELYKKSLRKAKDIRKNALKAYLEAKNIQSKYALDNIELTASDSEVDETIYKELENL